MFPAPSRLACVSEWYQFYWNFIRGGKYIFKIEEWHKASGPIIRVGPNELHINDPEFYNTCYTTNYKLKVYTPHYQFMGPANVLEELGSDSLHGCRKAILGPLFTRTSIQKTDKTLRNHVEALVERISQEGKGVNAVCATKLFRCTTVDYVSEYVLGSERRFDTVHGDLNAPFHTFFRNAIKYVWFVRFFWPVMRPFTVVPYSLMTIVGSRYSLFGLGQVVVDRTTTLAAGIANEKKIDKPMADIQEENMKEWPSSASVLSVILENRHSGNWVSQKDLMSSLVTLIGGGTETSANTMAVAIYEACLDSSIQDKLHEELVEFFPDLGVEITHLQTEKLPYLSGFIKETLRMAPGLPGRLPRIVQEGGLTIVSMSAYLMHRNPTAYPNPDKFSPDRWLTTSPSSPEEKYLVPFSKGSRSCIGINVVWAQLYITLAVLFRRFRFSLHKNNTLTHHWADNYTRDIQADLVVSVDDGSPARPGAMEKFSLGSENFDLRKRIAELEKELAEYRSGSFASSNGTATEEPERDETEKLQEDENKPVRLDLEEFRRYGRQMIMTEVGLDGQLQLKRSKVLLIGAGGLGCPAAAYLAGAGIGTIGIVDHDLVEPSNLHRQIMHTVDRVGRPKVESIIESLKEINPYPKYIAHNYALSTENAIETVGKYDLILDCTDSPQTRYMISDACVLLGKPLVSASALRSDGQLVVLNNPPGEGPCYRCVFPRPPPPDSVLSCGEGGVLGPVVGAMGVLMSTEALKVLLAKADRKKRRKPAHLSNDGTQADSAPTTNATTTTPEQKKFYMTIYSAFSDTPFRTIRMFGKRKTCQACSKDATITKESMKNGSLDYVAFCGGKASGRYPPLTKEEIVDVEEYQKLREGNKGGLLIDVRDDVQYGMCSLEDSINVPITTILTLPIAREDKKEGEEGKEQEEEEVKPIPIPSWLPRDTSTPIYFICRLGNDSRLAVQRLKQSGLVKGNVIRDVRGGLWEWSRKVDKSFPIY
ncbi:hypothetical protein H072_3792 [Dactylellina haptotyla CBS 200.50]|uniref:Adenylyltransferase and sulfurtransferase uba4 n=1 Tax=Dactylellina haptotyla (strain CBS 200.50) TaxID=1284197 RepID=S8C3F5_DACHA|nr:hypothetical protein H072_3792 [Dactylellina haptotyla CBS 200.50]